MKPRFVAVVEKAANNNRKNPFAQRWNKKAGNRTTCRKCRHLQQSQSEDETGMTDGLTKILLAEHRPHNKFEHRPHNKSCQPGKNPIVHLGLRAKCSDDETTLLVWTVKLAILLTHMKTTYSCSVKKVLYTNLSWKMHHCFSAYFTDLCNPVDKRFFWTKM